MCHKADVKDVDDLVKAQLHVHSTGGVGDVGAFAPKHPVTVLLAGLLCLYKCEHR